MRALLICVVSAFGSVSLIGCGGSSFHGTVGGGGGTGPQPDKNQPVVSGLSPATVVAAGPSFTLAVTGKNFAQGDTVEWNDFPLISTFVSSTQMAAKVPNILLYETGTAAIIVQTPIPYSLNFGSVLTITAPPPPGTAGFTISSVNVQANDMVWDPASQQLYVSVAATDSAHPNTITAIDPITSQFGASASAGSGADRLAASSDSSWLYAGIDPNGEVRRFALPGLASDIAIPIGADDLGRPNYAVDLETAPGSPNTIAVSQAANLSEAGQVVIYDGSTPRAANVSNLGGIPHPLGSLAWNSNGTNLYAAFNAYAMDTVAVLNVDQTGVQVAQTENLNSSSSVVTLGNIHRSSLTGYLYGDNGQVVDPIGGKVVNQLPINALTQGFVTGDVIALDDSLGMVWVLGEPSGGQSYAIEAFDIRTNALVGSINIGNIVGTPQKLIRWGSNGLAFFTAPLAGQQGGSVYIISGAFVTTPSVQVVLP